MEEGMLVREPIREEEKDSQEYLEKVTEKVESSRNYSLIELVDDETFERMQANRREESKQRLIYFIGAAKKAGNSYRDLKKQGVKEEYLREVFAEKSGLEEKVVNTNLTSAKNVSNLRVAKDLAKRIGRAISFYGECYFAPTANRICPEKKRLYEFSGDTIENALEGTYIAGMINFLLLFPSYVINAANSNRLGLALTVGFTFSSAITNTASGVYEYFRHLKNTIAEESPSVK